MANATSRTIVSSRGQTVVPAEIRRRYRIEEGDTLLWMDDGQMIKVVPLPDDAVKTLRGSGKGERLVERLLQERAHDKKRRS
jgi:AbrB family looped-hinge helix DNA binding protein